MKMLRKIIDCGSLEVSQENVRDGIYISKLTIMQCTDCSSNTKRLHYRFFLEFLLKTSGLRKNTLRKKYMVNQRFI